MALHEGSVFNCVPFEFWVYTSSENSEAVTCRNYFFNIKTAAKYLSWSLIENIEIIYMNRLRAHIGQGC